MEKELSQLTDQELLIKKKEAKASNILNAVLLGVMVGISIYSTITDGFGFLTVLPLFFVGFIASRWNKNKKQLDEELKSRNLK
jgi:uncharacterized membrane protein